MGPLHRLSSFLSASVVDVNNNKMGVKGKNKTKFAGDVDIFSAEKPKNRSLWPSSKSSKKNKGEFSHHIEKISN